MRQHEIAKHSKCEGSSSPGRWAVCAFHSTQTRGGRPSHLSSPGPCIRCRPAPPPAWTPRDKRGSTSQHHLRRACPTIPSRATVSTDSPRHTMGLCSLCTQPAACWPRWAIPGPSPKRGWWNPLLPAAQRARLGPTPIRGALCPPKPGPCDPHGNGLCRGDPVAPRGLWHDRTSLLSFPSRKPADPDVQPRWGCATASLASHLQPASSRATTLAPRTQQPGHGPKRLLSPCPFWKSKHPSRSPHGPALHDSSLSLCLRRGLQMHSCRALSRFLDLRGSHFSRLQWEEQLPSPLGPL